MADKDAQYFIQKMIAEYNEGSDLGTKMDKSNPTGTGALSLNRKENSDTGANSVAVGTNTSATAASSFAEGEGTVASAPFQHVQGKYNISDSTKAAIVGWGNGDGTRKNIYTLDPGGNAWFGGVVKAHDEAGNEITLGTGGGGGGSTINPSFTGTFSLNRLTSEDEDDEVVIGTKSFAAGDRSIAEGENSVSFASYPQDYTTETWRMSGYDIQNTPFTLESEISNNITILTLTFPSPLEEWEEEDEAIYKEYYIDYVTIPGSSGSSYNYSIYNHEYIRNSENQRIGVRGYINTSSSFNIFSSYVAYHFKWVYIPSTSTKIQPYGSYGLCSFSLGNGCYAGNDYSIAIGNHAVSFNAEQIVLGSYNNISSSSLLVVGNGSSSGRSNAFELSGDGDGWFAGQLWAHDEDGNEFTVKNTQFELDGTTLYITSN